MIEYAIGCLVIGNVWLASSDPRGAFWGPAYLLLSAALLLVEAVRNV